MSIGSWHVGLGIIPAAVFVGSLSWLVAHFCKSRWTIIGPLVLGAGGGIIFAVDAARSSGYVAPYSFAVAWLLSVTFITAGVPMLPSKALRRGGVIALLTGVSLLASFYIVVLPAKLLGLTAW